jgi:succinate dehydrogenase / fumarate reductase membrane anchor subunit
MNVKSIKNVIYSLNSKEHGLQQWLLQKVSAILLIPSSLLFIYFFSAVFGEGHEAVIVYFQNDFVALATGLFLVVSLLHLKQGLQVVIEDYVHNTRMNKSLLRIIALLTWVLSVLSIMALGKIAFGG